MKSELARQDSHRYGGWRLDFRVLVILIVVYQLKY